MNKVLITTLLFCTGLITAGCENLRLAQLEREKELKKKYGI
ncbi:hypothetical protein [Bartonella sp. MM73XJBT.G]|nr:hypothetical protein [Bartonella sp. MM73XJBT.G]